MNSYIQTRSRNWSAGLSMLLSVMLLFAVVLLAAPTVNAAEGDVTTWNTSGTCEWGIDPDGCLWIRPTDGVSGTLADWGISPPWASQQRESITSVVIKTGVSASTCRNMFNEFTNCVSIDLRGLDISNVTNVNQMFNDCNALTALDLSGFDTSRVENMSVMFRGCISLTSLDVSSFNTSNVNDMQMMFAGCASIENLDLRNFNTSSVANMRDMFIGCESLTSLDVSNFNTSNVTSMQYMFNGCSSLTSLDISCFDTSSATNMGGMFGGCQKLSKINLGANFSFSGDNISSNDCQAILPPPPLSTTSGKWVLENDVQGMSAMTPTEMRNAGTVTPGTWVWQMMPNYTVLYDANGGNGDYEPDIFRVDLAATLSIASPSKAGMIFLGWNTAADGSGVHYGQGGQIPANTYSDGDEVTLYAEWDNAFSIVYNLNDGSGETETIECGVSVANSIAIKNAYQGANEKYLVGWNTAADGTGTHYDMGEQIPANTFSEGNVLTLYGEWADEPVSTDPSSGIVYCSTDSSNFLGGLLDYEFGLMYDSGAGQFMYLDVDGTQDYQADGTRSFASPAVQGYRPVSVYKCTNYLAVVYGSGDVNDLIWEQTNLDPNNVTVTIPAYGAADIYIVLYEAVDPRVSELNVALVLDEDASVPSVTTALTLTPGTGIDAVPGTSMAVIAPSSDTGVTGTPTIGSAVFAPGDETVTSAEGVTVAAGQKAVVKNVEIDFREVTFSQPGIFRYLITEPSSGSGLTYDTQLGDTTDGVQYQRVLDVYVQRVDDADTGTTSYQIAGFVLHEVADAPAEGAAAVADKSAGFVNEYDTKTVTLESRVSGNQSSIDKYFAYTITVQNPNNSVFTVSADWTNAADALNPTANPATKYDAATITAANTAEWTSEEDGSLSKTIYLRNGQKVELDGIPAGATYAISVADEDYSPSWAIGSDNGTTNATGNRVLDAMEDVVFTLTREGVVPTGVMLSAVPGLIIMAGALIAIVATRKRKENAENA